MDTDWLQRIVSHRTSHSSLYTGRCTTSTWDVHGGKYFCTFRRIFCPKSLYTGSCATSTWDVHGRKYFFTFRWIFCPKACVEHLRFTFCALQLLLQISYSVSLKTFPIFLSDISNIPCTNIQKSNVTRFLHFGRFILPASYKPMRIWNKKVTRVVHWRIRVTVFVCVSTEILNARKITVWKSI